MKKWRKTQKWQQATIKEKEQKRNHEKEMANGNKKMSKIEMDKA